MNTELIIILDRSGSMSSIRADMEGGLNTFIANQKAEPGECRVTLAHFDTEYELLFEGRPIADCPEIVLHPRGGTALLDAVGLTLNAQNQRLFKDRWADKVIIVIITDGHENASKEYDLKKIKLLITQAEEKEWQFVFLGANQDAFDVASTMGMTQSMANHATYDSSSVGVRSMSAHLSATVTNLRK